MKKYLDILLSVLLNPLLFIGVLFYVNIQQNSYGIHSCEQEALTHLFVSFFINIYFFPSVLILLCIKLGFVKNLQLDQVKDRIIPMIGTMIFIFWAWRVAKEHPCLHTIIPKFLFGLFLSTILVVVVNSFIFLSFFSVGLSSIFYFCISMGLLTGQWAYISLLLLAVVGFFRWYWFRKEHHPIERIVGFLIGLLSQSIAFIII